ncbi:ECF-type riboflavin transporter substrate-binding protein [Anaerococcus tetradius]|uniref:ECF-type riboflavin transporter substrate-binding protein n=1 Tax=Anaerococcus tetradius TaxID=33036 RepID=UPI0023EFDC89|nr:ECF-type riboflavin transporter substrate-binding protein [Anaerococcus tetradius]
MKKNNSITSIVAIGIGAAVFFILGRFLSIPIGFIPNTSLETTYPFLALMSVLFGPFAGALIGLIGHAIKDLLTYGLWWSWVISSSVTGFGYGLVGKSLNVNKGEFSLKDLVKFNLGQIITNIVAWALVAPCLDILIYSEPTNKVFTQGIVSAGLNSIAVAILGSILLTAYAKSKTADNSLSKD